MTITSAQVLTGLSCVGTTSSTRVAGTLQIGTSQRRTALATADVAYAVIGHLTESTNTMTLDVQTGDASGTAETLATVTINPAGADNSITYTAVAGQGHQGNDITITYATPVVGSGTVAISVVGKAITITADSTKTAQDVITAVNADAAAKLLVLATASGTVTGVIAAVTATNLATGTGTFLTGGAGKDFEGTDIPSLTTLSAINIEVVQGSATVTNGTNIFPIPALIYGPTTGTLLTADLVITATADDTIVNITVLGID